jgi:hypothetical protein
MKFCQFSITPFRKNVIFENPLFNKIAFWRPPYTKMAYSRPPYVQQIGILDSPYTINGILETPPPIQQIRKKTYTPYRGHNTCYFLNLRWPLRWPALKATADIWACEIASGVVF